GIALELGAKVARVSGDANAVTLSLDGGREITGSHLLVAVGRRPNTDDLGCDAGGVALDPRGFVRIDGQYKTSAAGVYAVGDAAGLPQFTHVAWDDHRILFDLLLGTSTRGHEGRHVPYAVFTDPQIAGVGIGEDEARASGIEHEVGAMPFGQIARAIECDERAGLVKVLVDPKTDRVLGARVVGAEAAELVHVFVLLMQANASARALVDCECVHPAFAEGLQSALMKIGRFALS
ncbi:MAG TPA: FAD-dependent oxidoreductase, partial [Byssovorax sp.]